MRGVGQQGGKRGGVRGWVVGLLAGGGLALSAGGVVALALLAEPGPVSRTVPGLDHRRLAIEGRLLHARLAPTAERDVTAAELEKSPYLRQTAHGGVVVWEAGVVVHLDDSRRGMAVVVLSRPEAGLSAPMRKQLELREDQPPGAALSALTPQGRRPGLDEVEPGVYLRLVSR